MSRGGPAGTPSRLGAEPPRTWGRIAPAGVPCRPFVDASQASAYLESGVARPESEDLEARPDLRSLAAQQQSAEASLELARNRRIPDPTLRLGYVRDEFVAAGSALRPGC